MHIIIIPASGCSQLICTTELSEEKTLRQTVPVCPLAIDLYY